MKLNFPEYALKCQNILEKAGFEARFVGGCVRDGILKRSSNDIDITTNALPEEVMAIFEHTVPTGLKHGTVTVIIDGNNIEVTTYRTEGEYIDHRHPEEVHFASEIGNDLSRRDFTINAMAYDDTVGLIDLYGGLNDINKRIIRCVGEADKRFEEDALRILRAYRFASVLGFDIDKDIIRASRSLKNLLTEVSGERVLTELEKLALGEKPEVIEDYLDDGALSHFGIDGISHPLSLLISVTEKQFRLPVFFSLTNHNTEKIRKELKPNNILYKQIQFLDDIENYPVPKSKADIKRFILHFGEENFKLYLCYTTVFDQTASENLCGIYTDILDKKEPYLIGHLALDGNDLKNLGYSGEEIGSILNICLEHVIEYPQNNTAAILTANIKKLNHQ